MSLFYDFTHWLDHVVQYPGRKKPKENADGTIDFERAEGEVIQQGTPRNATHYNNQEKGILANSLQIGQLQQTQNQHKRSLDDLVGESQTVKLTNTKKYPFNNSGATVPISKERFSLDYTVETEIVSSDGFVGDVVVYDKQQNGFKIRFNGSAKNVTVKYKIVGGLYK